MNRAIFTGILVFVLIAACNSADEPKAVAPPIPQSQQPTSETTYRYEVFANVDSSGVQHGFGYDIFDGDKRLIHQTNIPGEPGTDGFVNETEAAVIAKVVVEKLRVGGGFPTLTHIELVDYGITLKTP